MEVAALLRASPQLAELDLTSCRGVMRGYKKAYEGEELARLRAHGFRQQADD